MFLPSKKESATACFEFGRVAGLMVIALVSGATGPDSSPAGDIVLCSWARHFTLTVPLLTQVYKWVPANAMLWVTLVMD